MGDGNNPNGAVTGSLAEVSSTLLESASRHAPKDLAPSSLLRSV